MASDATKTFGTTATDAEAGIEVEVDLAQTYDIVERDTVPAPAIEAGSSPQKRIDRIIQWLQPTEFLSPGNEFMKHLHSHVPGTGQWVHKLGPFRAWASLGDDDEGNEVVTSGGQQVYRCLHVRGVAGSGKSVFAASTVRQLQEPGCGRVNHTARYLVRDFAAQLLPHSPALVTALTALSQEHAVRGNELALVWPALVEALRKDDNLRGRVFCVVDALDEMDDSELDGMLTKLVALGTVEPPAARVMMTSRPLPHIEQALYHPGVARLRLDPALLSPDVARYVDARIASLDPPISTNKSALVRQTICERANGLFLQARLMTDNLAEGLLDGRITPETLPNSLNHLPRTLRELYEGMLREHARGSGVTAEQQAKILMCVTRASRPLRLIELGSLLAQMLHVDLRRGKNLIRRACGNLLELLDDETVGVIHHSFTEFLYDAGRRENGDEFPVLKDEASHAVLATLSLEYLDGCPYLDATIDDQDETGYVYYAATDNERERRAKIRTDINASHPLASYAVENLFFHMSKVSPDGTAASQLLDAIDRYFVPGKPAFNAWMVMKWHGPLSASFSIIHLITATPDGKLVPLYVLEHLVSRYLRDVDSRDAEGLTPLAWAAGYGHTAFAEVLLARGADPVSYGNDGLAPLHRAVRSFQVAIALPVRRVRKAESERYVYNAEEEDEKWRITPLDDAFKRPNNELIKVFMPFVPPGEVNKSFHQVRGIGNVKAILEMGKVDVDCFQSGATKLFHAARLRDPDLVKLLLDHGADPRKRCDATLLTTHSTNIDMEIRHPHNERGATPLHGFAGIGFNIDLMSEDEKDQATKSLQMLIEAGADVDATMDGEGYDDKITPLHIAIQNSKGERKSWGGMNRADEILVELLLSAGANPNAKTKKGNTPLHIANPEKPCLLELLVKHGADINALNAAGRSPLLELIYQLRLLPPYDKVRPNVRVFERLLELGADTNIADEQGDNILHHIIYSIDSFMDFEFMPFIRKLLDAGVDPNKKNKKGEPPLWNYLADDSPSFFNNAKNEALIRMLINAGLDLNARDNEGHTFLLELGKRHRTRINDIEMFIPIATSFLRQSVLGADPRALAPDGRTLLHLAVHRSESSEWFRVLVSVGVRTDTLTQDGGTIIHEVLRGSQDKDKTRKMLQLLVEAGVLPLARNTKGQSALHVANDLEKLYIVLNTPMFKGLDVNEPDIDGLTPLHHIVRLGEVAVRELLRRGADPTALTARGLSPLHVAASNGQADVVGLLLAQYRKCNVLETHINLLGNGSAPLHYACQVGSPETVWTLLHNGADARLADGEGLTPLHVLSKVGTLTQPTSLEEPNPLRGEIVRMLQFAGADVNAEVMVRTSDETTASRILTPLDMAVERQCWEVARGLIAHGAEPRDDHRRSEVFIMATDKEQAAEEARKARARAFEGQVSSIPSQGRVRGWRGRWAACPGANTPVEKGTHFIASGQDILDIKAKDVQHDGNDDNKVCGVNVLHGVLRDGGYDTIKEYAELGGDILEQDRYTGNSILHHIVKEGHVELLEHFGDRVTELDAQEWRKHPSLHLIKLLVEKIGVDVNAIHSCYGYGTKLRDSTALHILAVGAHFWQIEALDYLLSKGANIEAKNKDGMAPLLAAIDGRRYHVPWLEETLRVLLRHGANVNVTAKRTTKFKTERTGFSALELSDQPAITKLLLEHGASVESCPGILTSVIREWIEPEIVRLLLDAGADPNELPFVEKQREDDVQSDGASEIVGEADANTDEDLCYPLHQAARPLLRADETGEQKSRQQAIIDLLVSRGADAYASYPDGRFVFQAIVEERGDMRSLLPGLSRENCSRKSHHWRILLLSACDPAIPYCTPRIIRVRPVWTVVTELVVILLHAGVDPLVTDDDRRTPLHRICTFPGKFDKAYREAFAALTRHGPTAITKTDKDGRTPLHLALVTYSSGAQQFPFAIQHLLSAGADPADPDPVTGNSALHFIAPRLVGEATAAAEATVLFRSLAASLDVNARNAAGETPVFTFAAAGWRATRDPENKVDNPEYALAHDVTHAAVLEAVFADLALGVDLVGTTDARGRNLLHVTLGRDLSAWSSGAEDRHVQKKSLKGAFKKLLELGLNPQREDDELRTAIDIAVAKNLREIVMLFSEEGKRKEEKRRRRKDKGARGETDESEGEYSDTWSDLYFF
ncbi:ankyrin repeat-containing domain protein [Corynascus novoguineensis]|uniref:Ankyrin repeat-containing domain protein n=1 Tax=Corynascus novoguineensis TaxID=1126955 RepID=A0AAN7CU96_9PEZI|nr:ankyrin repeat-containing domain protein [Corynascus novoguineensis]